VATDVSAPDPDKPSKARVFISYSRKDIDFADRLEAALKARGFEPFMDRTDILAFEEWWKRIEALILRADTVVFVLSPDAVRPDAVALKEVAFAASLNKRFAPIVFRHVEDKSVPEELSKLNFIFFNDPARFDESADQLAEALKTDISWIRQHTEFGEQARRWASAKGPSGLLLRSPVLEQAERWVATRPGDAPEPTEETRTFVAESRRGATRRRNIFMGSLAAGLLIALVLTGLAYWQRAIAVANESRAVAGEQSALEQRDRALTTQSLFLADQARQASSAREPLKAELLAVEALPDGNSQSIRPLIPEAERAAYEGRSLQREILELHCDGSIFDAVFSPDQRHIATTGFDVVQLWDAKSGAALAVLRGQTYVKFSPDGKRVVTRSQDSTASVWDAETGAALSVLKGTPITTVEFSPDGKNVLTASKDNTARLWEAASGRELTVFSGHNEIVKKGEEKVCIYCPEATVDISVGGVDRASFGPYGKRILTIGVDGTARVWDAGSGEAIAVLKSESSHVRRASFSPNGKHILTEFADGTVRLWDAKSATATAILKIEGAALTNAAFTSDGRLIVTGSADGTVRIWDGGTLRNELKGDYRGNIDVTISPDSRLVAVVSLGSVRIWEIESKTEISVFEGRKAEFSPDSRYVLTYDDDYTVRVWDTSSKPELMKLRLPESYSKIVAFSADGKRMLTLTDHAVQLWDMQSGKVLRVLNEAGAASFGPGGQSVATGSLNDNTARVWDADTGKIKLLLSGHESRKERIPPSKTERFLAEQDSNYHIEETYEDVKGVESVSFSPDGLQLLTVGVDRTARVWDARTGTQLAIIRGQDREHAVSEAVFSRDGLRILTTSEYGPARLWNAQTGEEVLALGDDRVNAAAFSPDGRLIVTASSFSARLWEATSGVQVHEFKHNGSVKKAIFSPDGHKLAAISGSEVWVWNIDTSSVAAILHISENDTRWVSDIAFSPTDSTVLVTVGDAARFWRVFKDAQGLVDDIKQSAPRCLTPWERQKAFLPLEPPRWCITGPAFERETNATKWEPKWPYNTAEWRTWLIGADEARSKGLAAPKLPD
jgi:WD40 repeat protein